MTLIIIGIVVCIVMAGAVYLIHMIDKQARENEKRKSLKEAAKDANTTASNNAKRATDDISVVRKRMRKYTRKSK